MSEKELSARITALSKTKADIASLKSYATKADIKNFATKKDVDEATASHIWQKMQSPQFVGVLLGALTLIKLELPPLFSLEPLVDQVMEKFHIERRFGLLWKASDRAEREADAAERRLLTMEKGIGRLQDVATSAHNKIGNVNKRLNALEGRSGASRRAARGADQPRLADGASTEAELLRLESRVNALAQALA